MHTITVARPRDDFAVATLIFAQSIIATAPLLVRLSGLDPTVSAFWRMVLALPVLLVWAGVQGGLVRLPRRDMVLLALAGLAFAGDLACMHAAIKLTSVANATFLTNLAPIVVVLLAWPLFGERLRPAVVGGLGLALAGALLLMHDTQIRAEADPLGDLLGIGAALFFATYLLLVKDLRRRLPAATVMLGSSLAAALALGLMVYAKPAAAMPAQPSAWLAVMGLGVVAHAFGQGLTAGAIGRLPVGPASVMLLSQPVMTAALAWVILDEAPGLAQAAGDVAILAAVLLVLLPARSRR